MKVDIRVGQHDEGQSMLMIYIVNIIDVEGKGSYNSNYKKQTHRLREKKGKEKGKWYI